MRMLGRTPMVLRIALMASVGAFVLLAAFAPTTPAAADVDTLINLAGGIAQPATTNVSVGTRVIWVNRQLDGALTITSDTGAFDPNTLMPGQSFAYVFNQTGTFAYHATQTPGVRGRVVVSPAQPPVRVMIPPPPPARVQQQNGVNIPQSSVGTVNQLPGPAAPPVYLPLASAPPAPVRPTPVGYTNYGYAVPGPIQPAYGPRTGGGGLASSYVNEDDPASDTDAGS